MQWSIIKSWAKEKGYETFREKTTEKTNQYDYYWGSINDPSVSGMTTSVSKLATNIFNHMTNNQYCEYQTEYKEKQSKTDINHNELSGSGW